MTDQSPKQSPKQDAPTTQPDQYKGANTDGRHLPENSKESLDRKLDEGIEETFPASDPVSVKITK
jgi:hypothetical protein